MTFPEVALGVMGSTPGVSSHCQWQCVRHVDILSVVWVFLLREVNFHIVYIRDGISQQSNLWKNATNLMCREWGEKGQLVESTRFLKLRYPRSSPHSSFLIGGPSIVSISGQALISTVSNGLCYLGNIPSLIDPTKKNLMRGCRQ